MIPSPVVPSAKSTASFGTPSEAFLPWLLLQLPWEILSPGDSSQDTGVGSRVSGMGANREVEVSFGM